MKRNHVVVAAFVIIVLTIFLYFFMGSGSSQLSANSLVATGTPISDESRDQVIKATSVNADRKTVPVVSAVQLEAMRNLMNQKNSQ